MATQKEGIIIMLNISGSKRITDDEIVTEGRGILYGFVFDVSVDGAAISIYDGLDSTSGRLLFHCTGWASDPNSVMFGVGIPFETGLYVTLATNVSDATLLFRPIRGSLNDEPTTLLETLRSILIPVE
jgi:hypothetical protein